MSGELPEELLDIETDDIFGEEGDEGGETEPVETERVTIFDLEGQSYATPVLDVRQVVEPSPITRVPRTSPAVDGIVDLRGEIVAVVNPWEHLDIEGEPNDWEDQLLAVFTVQEDEQPVGIRIDAVLGVEAFPVDRIVRGVGPDDPGPNTRNPMVEGVIEREEDGQVVERIGLLDTEAVITASRRYPEGTAGPAARR